MGRTAAAIAGFAVLAAASAAEARDIHLPGDFRNLQEALDAADPGDRVVLDRGTYRGRFLLRTGGVEIVGGPKARIVGIPARRGEWDIPSLDVRGVDSTVRGVAFRRSGLRIEGDRATVEECAFAGIHRRGRGNSIISVAGNWGVVRGNTLGRSAAASRGIEVYGLQAVVSGNRVEAKDLGTAIAVDGNSAIVEDNAVAVEADSTGVMVEGSDGRVLGNQVAKGDLCVFGPGNLVEGNEVVGTALGRASFQIVGSENIVRGNEARDGRDTGFLVQGNRNLLQDNAVSGNGTVIDGENVGHGFVARGSANRLVGDTADGCVGEGFRIVGNETAGWSPDPTTGVWTFSSSPLGPGNVLRGCTGTRAGTCGLVNWTIGTTVEDSTFTGNGVDVVDGSGFQVFDGNTYETGGPWFSGSSGGRLTGDTYVAPGRGTWVGIIE